jgi:hypothetical protein
MGRLCDRQTADKLSEGSQQWPGCPFCGIREGEGRCAWRSCTAWALDLQKGFARASWSPQACQVARATDAAACSSDARFHVRFLHASMCGCFQAPEMDVSAQNQRLPIKTIDRCTHQAHRCLAVAWAPLTAVSCVNTRPPCVLWATPSQSGEASFVLCSYLQHQPPCTLPRGPGRLHGMLPESSGQQNSY